jgi:tRNA 5-methylaminomethyl-2-thiouridine biosynthesis bifunctional protein
MSASPKGAIRSKEFDDVYFSTEDGLAETRHVFLDGNDLPAAWAVKQVFLIAETGFGTGLNFLAAWKLFNETAAPGQALNFISFEKYPLSIADIESALQHWIPSEFAREFAAFKERYPQSLSGTHDLKMADNVHLRLIFDDVNKALPALSEQVDCWFLDGFKPASNPEMWSLTVFENMVRLSKPGASFATFTAAGFVRRGLRDAGFDVRKVKGFGLKRDMLVGRKP